jgi:hypothetical protein
MNQALRSYSLVPSGFVVVTAVHDTAMTTITVRSSKDFGVCPSCGTVSRRVHSRYQRRACDLPLSGRSVKLLVVARRFRCDAVLCGRQIFAERFANDVLAPWARRTSRLDYIVHHLGLALGGRPGASFSQRLMLPVSKDTLLRVVRRRARGNSCVRSFGANGKTSSAHGRVRWRCTSPGSMLNGCLDTAMAQTCGGASRSKGFAGRSELSQEWATRRRRAEKADAGSLQRIPSARTIARLMTIGRHALSKAETVTIAAIENGVPSLVEAREIIAAFQAMVRNKVDAELAAWLARARSSLVASFAT